MNKKPYRFEYEFILDSDETLFFPIQIHPRTLNLMAPIDEKPEWAKLDNHRCGCCTLDGSIYPYCPAALNIVSFILASSEVNSTDWCKASYRTPLKTIVLAEKIMIQNGLASILFLILIASECPILGLFKPFIRTHVPFVSIKEVVVQIVSILLLGDYFKAKMNNHNFVTLDELNSKLESFKTVYHELLLRIKKTSKRDANCNAFVIIESMNQLITMEIDDGFKSIEYLFESWGKT